MISVQQGDDRQAAEKQTKTAKRGGGLQNHESEDSALPDAQAAGAGDQSNAKEPLLTVNALLVGVIAGATLIGTLNGQWQQWWLKWVLIPAFVILGSIYVCRYLRAKGIKHARGWSTALFVAASLLTVTLYSVLPSPSFIVNARVTFRGANPNDETAAQFWYLNHFTVPQTNLHPLHIIMLVDFTNLTPEPLSIYAYSIETRTRFSRWKPVHAIHPIASNVYWGTAMNNLKRIEFEQPIFDTFAAANEFASRVPVRVWLFMETPAEWPRKYWRMRLIDVRGESLISPTFQLPETRTINSMHIVQGRHTASWKVIEDKLDLSKIRRRLHSAAHKK